jgi:hypothetical protein
MAVFTGDSITAGTGVTAQNFAYPGQAQVLLNAIVPGRWTVLNKGVGGLAMDEMVDAYPADIAPLFTMNMNRYRRRVLVSWEAVNMLRDGHTPQEVADSYEEYVGLAKATGWEMYVGTCPTTTASEPEPANIAALNALILANGAAWGADGILGFGAMSLTMFGQDGSDYFDATHLNDAGSAKLATLLKPALDP